MVPVEQSSNLSNPAELTSAYLRSFSTGDPDLIAGHVCDAFVNEHTAALGSGCIGRETYRERLLSFLADMVDLRYEIEHLLVDGDEVAAFYTMTASWQGTAPIRVRGVQRLEVADGCITRRVDYWDSAVFLTQVSAEARVALAPFGIKTPE